MLENVKILKEAGANLNHVVIDHMDCMEFSSEIIHKLLDMGCTVEYDTTATELVIRVLRQYVKEAA